MSPGESENHRGGKEIGPPQYTTPKETHVTGKKDPYLPRQHRGKKKNGGADYAKRGPLRRVSNAEERKTS